ncbi:MAG: hypothetical protein EOM23_11720, partial [Candidatus Moranbacteria bacterium]|nr:hypothetical protein [Candidatus Moranbacteria bacterium]
MKINFPRNKVEITVDNMGMKFGEKIKYSFWSPVIKRAHEPENFGTIENMKDFHAEAPFLPGISKTAIGNYKYLNGKISYDVSAEIISFSHVDGKFTLLLQEENKNTGKLRDFTKEGFLSGRSKTNISFDIPTENFSTCDINLILKDTASGAVLQKLNIGTSSSAFSDAYPDRNYYTDEKQVNIRCTFSLPEKILQECSLKISDKGSDLKKVEKLFSETTFPVDLNKFKIGENTIKVSLNDSKNHILGEKEIQIVKLTPNPGLEVKTDRFQRVILKNNVPFFPFGIFLSSEFIPVPEYEVVLKNFKDNGLNSIIRTMKYEDFYVQANKAYFDMTSKYKLMTGIW